MADVDVKPTPTPDTPPASQAGGAKGFLTAKTGGVPNWAWILVVVAGVGAAIFLPKFLNKGGTNQPTDQSALGLAIDPTTGLPYAVEGLVPSGATTTNGTVPPTTTTTTQDGTTTQDTTTQGTTTQDQDTTTQDTTTQGTTTKTPPTLASSLIRQAGSSDSGVGVPIRQTPSGAGKIVGHVSWGSSIMIVNGPVQGASNYVPDPQNKGSKQWYQISGGGYISAKDFSKIGSVGGAGSTGPHLRRWPYG